MKVLSKCVSNIVPPINFGSLTQYVLFVGACQNQGTLYIAEVQPRQGCYYYLSYRSVCDVMIMFVCFAGNALEINEFEYEMNETAASETVKPATVTSYTLLDAKMSAGNVFTLLFKLTLNPQAERFALFQNRGVSSRNYP